MKKAKQQVFVIHGGMTFKTRRDYLKYLKTRPIRLKKRLSWAGEYLEKSLGRNFEIIAPRMPLQDFAQYTDWKIHFERFIPYLRKNVILIGSSLGGIFLAKYLSENTFPKKILSIHLVCPPFDDTLTGEDLVGGFRFVTNLSRLEKSSKNLHLYFSSNDDVVPVGHAKKYRAKLPHADIRVFKNKNGHFNISTFPELVVTIKQETSRKPA